MQRTLVTASTSLRALRSSPALRSAVLSRSLSVVAAARPASRIISAAFQQPAPALNGRRFLQNASGFKQNKDVSYDEIKALASQPTEDVYLIDVREPDEVMLGSIPSSVNLPLSSFEQALSLDESDFTRAYGFRKPKKSTPMIFFCKAGIRSASATSLAKSKGFSQVRNYPGSYADWEAHQSKSDD